MFKNRVEAGKQLAKRLLKYKDRNVVVLAIPRGGLPIGAIVSKALSAPLDVVLTKKIGHPFHKEYAIGAVNLEDVILTDTIGIEQEYIDSAIIKIRERLKDLYLQYYKNRLPIPIEEKTVILIDDGIATGNTIMATIALLIKQKPRRIIVAVPVAPISAIRKLEKHPYVNDVICMLESNNFKAVGQFYDVFDQVTNKEAIRLLEENMITKKI